MKKQRSPFATFLSGPEGLPWNTHGSTIFLTLPIRSAGVDDPFLRLDLGILAVIKTEPAAQLLSWQRYDGCHYVSFVMYIAGAKFEEHCFNIARVIFD